MSSVFTAWLLVLITFALALPMSAAGKKALQTPINGPFQLAFDSAGDLYVNEDYGHRIFRIDPRSGSVTFVAGNGQECCYRDNADARQISIYKVYSLAVDGKGNLFFGGKNAKNGAFVRMVDSKSKRVKTIAGSPSPISAATTVGVVPFKLDLSDPKGLAIMPSGILLVSTDESNQIVELGELGRTFAGGVCESDDQPSCFRLPGSLTVDTKGNIFVADYFHHRIKRIDGLSHVITTIAGNGSAEESGDGGPAVQAGIPYPFGAAVDSEGNLFLIENGGHRIRRVDAKTGLINTIAGIGREGYSGDGGPALEAEISPAAIALDSAGNLFFSDLDHNRIRVIDRNTGIITTFAGNGLPKRKVIIE